MQTSSLFHPVIKLPEVYEVFDFTGGYDPNRTLQHPYGIGRYNEKRAGMYDAALFSNGQSVRNIHMGIDIGAPVGTEVFAFADGEIFLMGYNAAPFDYGYTLITKHKFDERPLYVLHGHLNALSVQNKSPGQQIRQGEVIAWVGDKHENGGWNPHLHFQLSRIMPLVADMPGVVSERDRAQALLDYPDPRMILGPIY